MFTFSNQQFCVISFLFFWGFHQELTFCEFPFKFQFQLKCFGFAFAPIHSAAIFELNCIGWNRFNQRTNDDEFGQSLLSRASNLMRNVWFIQDWLRVCLFGWFALAFCKGSLFVEQKKNTFLYLFTFARSFVWINGTHEWKGKNRRRREILNVYSTHNSLNR